jgi:hypothetical protein
VSQDHRSHRNAQVALDTPRAPELPERGGESPTPKSAGLIVAISGSGARVNCVHADIGRFQGPVRVTR